MRKITGIAIVMLISACTLGQSSDIKRLKKEYNRQIISTEYAARHYFCETHKLNGKYVAFADGLGFFISTGYDYDIPMGTSAVLPTNIRQSDISDEWRAKTSIYISSKDGEVLSATNFPPLYDAVWNSYRRFELFGPFGEATKDFEYKVEKDSRGAVSRVEFNPISRQSSGFKGRIYYSKGTIDSVRLEKVEFYHEQTNRMILANMLICYAQLGDKKIYPHRLHLVAKHKEQLSEGHIELQSKPHILSNTSATTKNMHLEQNNICPIVFYDRAAWVGIKTPNVNLATIGADIGAKQPLEKQFESHNGNTFYTMNYTIPRADPIEEQKQYVKRKIAELERLIPK